MPALSDPTTWRSEHYESRQYLFVLQPQPVFVAQVDQASFTYPLSEVTFDGVTTGAYTDIKPGMTVVFGVSEGYANFGRQRIRKAATSDTIYIGRSSQGTKDGEVNLVDNITITVWDDFRPWAKIPYIDVDGNDFKDYDIPVTNYTTYQPPVANTGPAVIGFVDAVSGVLEVEFDGSTSFDPQGLALAYSWGFPAGDSTVTVNTPAHADPTVEFDPGVYWVSLTVTANSSLLTHTAWVPVIALTGTDDPLLVEHFRISSHRLTPSGTELSVIIEQDINELYYPDGTLVILFEDERYSDVKQHLAGIAGRENLRFVGWHHSEPTNIQASETGTTRNLTFNCLDILGKLRTLPGFPQSIDAADAPVTDWYHMPSPDIDKYILYILRWHSTALELADFTWSGLGSTYPYPLLGSDGENLFEQVQREAESIAALFTCNSAGQTFIKADPMLQAFSDRPSTSIVSLTEADFTSLNYQRERPPKYHWIRGNALTASLTDAEPLFAVAAGFAPGQGERSREFGHQIVVDQDELNTREGQRYARLNATEGPWRLALTYPGWAGFEPANMEWVTMSTSESFAIQRGLSLLSARFLIQTVDITYNYQPTGTTKAVSIELEREVFGGTAQAEYMETSSQTVNQPPSISFPTIYEPNIFDAVPFTLSPAMYGVSREYIARNRSHSSVDWSDGGYGPLFTASVDFSSEVFSRFVLDPWDPKNRAYLLTLTSTYESMKVYEITSLNAAGGGQTVNLLYTYTPGGGYTVQDADLRASINVEGGIYIVSEVNHGATFLGTDKTWRMHKREGYSASWDVVYIENATWPDRQDNVSLELGPHAVYPNGRIYVTVSDNGKRVYRSDNLGDGWTDEINTAVFGYPVATAIKVPYAGNDNDDIAYMFMATSDAGDYGIWKRISGTWQQMVQPELTPGFYYSIVDNGFSLPGNGALSSNSVDIYTMDPNCVRFVSCNIGLRSDLLINNNGAVGTWKAVQLPSQVTCIGGWPNDRNVMILWGNSDPAGNAQMMWTPDNGSTIYDLAGTGAGSWDTEISVTSPPHTIVPVWVE